MLQPLKRLFSLALYRLQAHELYIQLVMQARLPFFYRECAIADTIDGRFDVITLHMFIITHRLKAEHNAEAGKFSRALTEVFFADMDRSLREMGSTDTGVGKRVKKMVQAFYGRIYSYEETLSKPGSFQESLKRNMYRSLGDELSLQRLSQYVARAISQLQQQDVASLMQGKLSFSPELIAA